MKIRGILAVVSIFVVIFAFCLAKSVFADIHDVALTSISLSANQVFGGLDLRIEVGTENLGDVSEAFNLTVYANGTYGMIGVDIYSVSSLGPSDEIVIPFVWNTKGISAGDYTIVANASIVEGESNIMNNVIIGGNVTVLEDATSPVIDVPLQDPRGSTVPEYSRVWINVNVSDSQTGIDTVIVSWKVNNETTWQNKTMDYDAGQLEYYGFIPEYQGGTFVSYRIIAIDRAGNQEVRDHAGNYYTYTVISEFSSSITLAILVVSTLLTALIMRQIKSREKISRAHKKWL